MGRNHIGVMLGTVLVLAGQAAAQDILREAVGDRAAELAKMELKPFDVTLWSTLSGWTNGQALEASATNGRVVLIATWASWNPAASRAIPMLQELKEEYGDAGLVVVGVHHPTGWEKAADALERRHADFLIAHDAEGKFRAGIKSDQDPDFYVIDRAGQLRYADIRTESVSAAVKQLIEEDAASAGSLVARMEADAAKAEAEFQRPQEIRSRVNLGGMPEVPFAAPGEAAYAVAGWPVRKVDEDNRGRDERSGPRPMPAPGSGWVDGQAPKTDGRAVVYYSWMLDDPASANLVREMDTLQKQLGRDAVIVGVLVGVRSDNRSRGRDDDGFNPEEMMQRVQRFRTTHGVTHPMVIDIGGGLFRDDNRSRDESAYHAAVVSSDSVARWEGSDRDGFRAALNRVIDVDPGIRARRAAEEAYIRAKGG